MNMGKSTTSRSTSQLPERIATERIETHPNIFSIDAKVQKKIDKLQHKQSNIEGFCMSIEKCDGNQIGLQKA